MILSRIFALLTGSIACMCNILLFILTIKYSYIVQKQIRVGGLAYLLEHLSMYDIVLKARARRGSTPRVSKKK
jgi:hypothetical protein